ncbi:MAG: YtxH domain-containing protein [Atopostipes suicloacalis]|nr:YtxH domain-containing protein [Atopostipes suicloacalis]
MKENNQESSTVSFILGAIFGAVISAIAALLFAPKSGKDLRKDIGESTTKTLENTDEYLNLAREKGTKVIHDVEDAASNYFNLAEGKMKSTFGKAEKELDKKSSELDEMIDEAIEEIDEIEE